MKLNVVSVTMILSVTLLLIRLGVDNKHSSINTKKLAKTKNSVISPSGKYKLNVIEEKIKGVKSDRFIITKYPSKKVKFELVFNSNSYFRTRDAIYFTWGKNDSVWVYSGDVGTFFWKHTGGMQWQKFAYADNKSIAVPDLLKKLKPNYYEDINK